MSMAVLGAPANAAQTLMADTMNTGTILIEEGGLLSESASRMDEEGCSNKRTATLPDATGYSGIGGRLHLVGSPIF